MANVRFYAVCMVRVILGDRLEANQKLATRKLKCTSRRGLATPVVTGHIRLVNSFESGSSKITPSYFVTTSTDVWASGGTTICFVTWIFGEGLTLQSIEFWSSSSRRNS